jgi:hypothetical protein
MLNIHNVTHHMLHIEDACTDDYTVDVGNIQNPSTRHAGVRVDLALPCHGFPVVLGDHDLGLEWNLLQKEVYRCVLMRALVNLIAKM